MKKNQDFTLRYYGIWILLGIFVGGMGSTFMDILKMNVGQRAMVDLYFLIGFIFGEGHLDKWIKRLIKQ